MGYSIFICIIRVCSTFCSSWWQLIAPHLGLRHMNFVLYKDRRNSCWIILYNISTVKPPLYLPGKVTISDELQSQAKMCAADIGGRN